MKISGRVEHYHSDRPTEELSACGGDKSNRLKYVINKFIPNDIGVLCAAKHHESHGFLFVLIHKDMGITHKANQHFIYANSRRG